jgi:type II secretory pathway pseudopilin PulG
VDRRGFSLIDVLVAVSLFALVAGLSLLALYKVEGARRAYAKEAVIRQVLLWYAGQQGISSFFSWRIVAHELNPARLPSRNDPIAPLVSSIYNYYAPNRIYAVLDSAPMGITYTASNAPGGGYFLETRSIKIALQLGGVYNSLSIFTLGNDLFAYSGQAPSKTFVAVP